MKYSYKWLPLKSLATTSVIATMSMTFVYAQTTVQKIYWLRYYGQFKLGEKIAWHLEADDRFYFDTNNGFQLIIHNHLHYKINPYLDVATGLSYSRAHSNKNPNLVVPEWRPFQEVNIDFFPKLKQHKPITFRLRVDERFIHQNDGTELQTGTKYSTRIRFRLQTAWQLTSFNEGERKLIIKANDEYMVHRGDVLTTFDQNRIYGALEYYFRPNLSLEAGYLNLYQANGTEKHFLRHILRITLTHKLSLIR